MTEFLASTIQHIAVMALPILFAVTLEKSAQSYAIHALGDDTPRITNRLSWNPFYHLDWLGSVIFPLGFVLLGGISNYQAFFLLAWAKPLAINWRNVGNPKQGLRWLGIASIASTFFLTVCWCALIVIFEHVQFMQMLPRALFEFLKRMAYTGVQVGTMFFLYQLLPFPPFGLGRVLLTYLPLDLAMRYARIESYSMVVLVLLIFTGILALPLQWLYVFFFSFIHFF